MFGSGGLAMRSAEWYREKVLQPSLSEADKAAIRGDWEILTGKDFTASFNARCPNCYHDAATLILHTMSKRDNGGYQLKAGVAFRYKGKIYTRDNITAPAAEWYIKQNPTHRDDFLALAKDYDSYGTDAANPTRGE